MKNLSLVVSIACLLSVFTQEVHSQPTPIIFDTDMDTDCDDTGALAMLHGLVNRGEAEILATVVSSHYPWSAPCAAAINAYFNRPDIPIGAPKMPGADINRGSRYAKQISKRFAPSIKTNDDALDAVAVYRRILTRQQDQRVVIVTVGYLTNLAHLLDSEPDEYSPLTGRQLIEKSVKLVVCMGGRYPKHLDPGIYGNFKPDPAAAVKAANEWPGTILFTGLGEDVLTGESLKDAPDDNPVKMAYRLYLGDKPARPSWDLFAVLYAVRPDEPYWIIQKEGHNHIFKNGTNEWCSEDWPNHWQLHIKPGQKPVIKKVMNDLMAASPQRP